MAATKKSAGSTLAFLATVKAPGQQIVSLSLDSISTDPNQPRKAFHATDGQIDPVTEQALRELAADIQENNLLQPITVRPDGKDKYIIVMGERRYRAMCLNRDTGVPNSEKIDAIVRDDLSPQQLRAVQLAENLQREDLSDIETAAHVRQMLEDFPEMQKQELGRLMKKNSQYVSRILALLDPRWASVIDSGLITYASLLEQFRALPEDQRHQVTKKAIEEKRTITSGDIKSARKEVQDKKLTKNVLLDVQKFTASEKNPNETYEFKSPEKTMRIVDTGGEAVIPTGASALNPNLLQVRELKLTLGQLKKLLKNAKPKSQDLVFTAHMEVNDMRLILEQLHGDVPDDDSLLPMTLAQHLNNLPN